MNQLLILLLFSGILWGTLCVATAVEQHPLKLQPEFDRVETETAKYLRNEKLVKLLFKCLIFDEPCDVVGKFIKPRAKGALLGNCEKCTPAQEKLMQQWFGIFKEKFPEMYKAALKKFVDNEGKTLTEEDKVEFRGIFSEEALKEYLEVYRQLLNKLPAKNDENGDSTKTRSKRSVTRNIRTLSGRNKRQFEVPTFPPFTLDIPSDTNSNETSSSTTTTPSPSPPGETTTPTHPETTLPPTSPPISPPPPPPFTLPPAFTFPTLPPFPEFKLPKFPSFGK